MTPKYVSLCAVGVAALSAYSLAQDKPDGQWHGSFNVGANFSSGNTRSSNVAAGIDANRVTEQDKITLYLNALRAESKTNGENKKTADTQRAGGRYEWNVTPLAYTFGSLDFERDKLAELNLRSVFGLGAGYFLTKEKDNTFSIFGGATYTRDDYADSLAKDRNYATLLFGEESSHALSETTSLKQRFAIYPDLDDTGEYRYTFDASLANKLAGSWTLNVNLAHKYVSKPPPDVKKADTLLFVGVGAKF